MFRLANATPLQPTVAVPTKTSLPSHGDSSWPHSSFLQERLELCGCSRFSLEMRVPLLLLLNRVRAPRIAKEYR
ncbi:hypothetical protein EXN66_Car002779 [Channa argus]|uniref:Uncharacterized protein n=1 Tax=Channa argus TaxID=215402 RepID=A0A6G1PA31_CHAAH|nr:hypothetical protein EXN66_Car002779 [Channa argus]